MTTQRNMVPDYDSLQFASSALRTRAHRHQLLAANLVNADTPAFLARDVDFSSELRRAMGGGPLSGLAATHDRHITHRRMSGSQEVMFRVPAQPAADGNTVDPDVERAHFAENTMGMELAMMALAATVRSRRMAWSGQV